MNGFGDFIRTRREKQGLSLRGLAKAVCVTPSYMSDIEKGNRHPSSEALVARIVWALHLQGDEAYRLYDIAAEQRYEAPKDIMAYVREHKEVWDMLRERMTEASDV